MDATDATENSTMTLQVKKSRFDDVFQWVRSFGGYQRAVFIGVNLILLPISLQFMLLVFGSGTPRFHCNSPNSTCPENNCCENCSSYEFDGPFTSAVSEVSRNYLLVVVLHIHCSACFCWSMRPMSRILEFLI